MAVTRDESRAWGEQLIFVVILANADIHGGVVVVQAVCWPLPS